MPTGLEPPLRGCRVVGEAETVNPGRFRGRGHLADTVPAHQLRVVRMTVHRVGDGEPHDVRTARVSRSPCRWCAAGGSAPPGRTRPAARLLRSARCRARTTCPRLPGRTR